MLVMMVMSALGLSLALITSTERKVTAAYREGLAVLYAADAAIERVLPDIATVDVSRALRGEVMSSFTDGAPGTRQLPDGASIELHTLTSMVTCGRSTCSAADLDAISAERPWGRNNPTWRLFGYGSLDSSDGGGNTYVIVWIADDPSETDNDPSTDGAGTGPEDAGRGRLSLLAHAYGPFRTHRIVEATIANTGSGIRMLSWRTPR
jgi:hypothetical protein